jgi:hypothetical protein
MVVQLASQINDKEEDQIREEDDQFLERWWSGLPIDPAILTSGLD